MIGGRRKWASLLVNPQLQVRYGAFFLAVSIVVHAVSTVVLTTYYATWMEGQREGYPISPPVLAGGLLLIYILIYGFSFVLGLLVTHRLYGPMVNIQRHFDSVRGGNLKSRVELRTEDDEIMKRLAGEINELTARLESLTNKGG